MGFDLRYRELHALISFGVNKPLRKSMSLHFYLSLQACLKALYVTWVSCDSKLHPPLEPLVIDLLTKMHLPAINCLPVKRQFGSLKELVLYPVFEESSLPYTSDAAIKLLRSVGE